jgi:hypothetical protein
LGVVFLPTELSKLGDAGMGFVILGGAAMISEEDGGISSVTSKIVAVGFTVADEKATVPSRKGSVA